MAKKAQYSKKLAEEVASLIKEDSYTIAEICQKVNISERSFYNWRDKHAEFADAIKEAQEEFEATILVECEKSLRKLITGYSVDETKTIYINTKDDTPKIKERTVTKKHFQPNLGAIIHFQTNKDPENWRNRQNVDITTKGKEFAPARVLTKQEAKDLLKDLDNEY